MWMFDFVKNMFSSSNNEEKQVIKKFEVGNYSVEITDLDPSKLISSIWKLKEILWIWLKEAKELLTNLPSSAISWISKIDAEKIKEKLEELWLWVEVKSK